MEIQGYPNYLIYEDGRVWSKNRGGKFLKPGKNNDGYLQVVLFTDQKGKTMTIHRLVALHYIPNPENKRCVDHLNRIKSDNRLENLRWATYCENQQNKGTNPRNKSGHKYVSYDRLEDRWVFQRREKNKYKIQKYFKTKNEALCYKYIALLKINAKIF